VFARRLRRAGTTELEYMHISRHDGIEWSFEDKDSVLSVPLAALDGLHEASFTAWRLVGSSTFILGESLHSQYTCTSYEQRAQQRMVVVTLVMQGSAGLS
jgi:hypothetical protein